MELVYKESFRVSASDVDRFGRLRPSRLLCFAQEVAGTHFNRLHVSLTTRDQRELFWAITRHRVQITRLPREGETISVETWPLPNTRVAYPRSTVAYDEKGRELFRSISLWVLMDRESRSLIVPDKSGIAVRGVVRGNELAVPNNLLPAVLSHHDVHTVRFSELDVNGHANNTRYLDWIEDLLPSAFHETHPMKELTICYLSEAREGQHLDLAWELQDGPCVRVDAHREKSEDAAGKERVFSARVVYDTDVL